MRVYIPRTPRQITARGSLPPGTRLTAFAVRQGDGAESADPEELEYEAMLTAAYAAAGSLLGSEPDSRVAVLAADSPLTSGPDADGNVGLEVGSRFRPVSVHVSEAGAAAIEADDTAPDLLWFDISETGEAARYAQRAG